MNNSRMLRHISAIVTVLILLSLNLFAGAGESEISDSTKYMSVDEIEPGMKGYGLTVFSGTKIEKFDVEIIGVLYGSGTRSDLILARIAGGPIGKAGVIAGMSGSPIYMDGRIIGALAYSWAFSKEAIAGITPIEEMLRIFDFPSKEKKTGAEVATPVAWANQESLNVTLPSMVSESVVMRPIMTPMVFSGFSDEAIESFRPELEGWGLTPIVGGSYSKNLSMTDASLQEGAAVGVQLVRGDMNSAAIGTVTVKEGDRILAFGHPFMLSGSVDFPMTTAFIHTILPSMVVSSKVGTAMESVGVMNQDRNSGIAGILGGSADMVPFVLSVRGAGDSSARTLEFEIARNRTLFPSLAGMALGSALRQVGSNSGEFAARVHYEIELDGFPTIRNDDFISGMTGFPSLASLGLYRDLDALLENRFSDISIKSVSMTVEVQETVESANITGARIQKEIFNPGEDIELKVIMKPYVKEQVEEKFVVAIPEHFPEGRAFLSISAAPQTAAFERMRAPHRFMPVSIESLLKLVDEDYPGNRIDIRVLVSDPGMIVKGQEMPALPSSVFSVISQTMGRERIGITRSSVLLEKQAFMDFKVAGAIVIPIEIQRMTR